MDEEIKKILAEQDKKLDAIFKSAEKTRKYFLWTLIISVVVIVLSLIGISFLAPQYIKTINPTSYGL